MNGRCETDPLDRAVDVCDSCYGEFCRSCLVAPNGRRHPICADCALRRSGVRGHGAVQSRGERGTAKSRRAEIKATAGAVVDEQVFRFFDSEAPTPPEPDPERPKRARKRARPAADPVSTPAESPAAATNPGTSDVTPSEPLAGGEPGTGDGRNRPSLTPAVARLEELRRQQETADETGEADQQDGELNPQQDRTADQQDGAPDQQDGELNPQQDPTADQQDGTADQQDRVSGSARRRSTDHPAGPATPQPPTAPTIGPVRTIGGRRGSDRAQPLTAGEPGAPGGTSCESEQPQTAAGNGVEGFDAAQPATTPAADAEPDRDASQAGPRADTDANGNWIPPLLRGMAPDAREASASLPQRRKG